MDFFAKYSCFQNMTENTHPKLPPSMVSFFRHGGETTHAKTSRYVQKQNVNQKVFDTDIALRRFIMENAEEISILTSLLSAQSVEEKTKAALFTESVQDPKTFCCALKKLKEAPFCPELCGEDPSKVFGVRMYLTAKLDSPNATDRVLEFACWCIWMQYKTRIYLHIDIIKSFCSKWKLSIHDMIEYILPHPSCKGMYTSPKLRADELCIASCLQSAETCAHADSWADAISVLPLDDVQKSVITSCLSSPVSLIVGGAGVGKTTLLSHLVGILCAGASAKKIVCMAFTHKARRCLQSKFNMSSSPEITVCTIHSYISSIRRLLSDVGAAAAGTLSAAKAAQAQENARKAHQMQEHFYIIDESSMVDFELLAQLCQVLTTCKSILPKFKYQLCIVGDDGQLPPIDRGELFREFCAGSIDDCAKKHRLERCYRTNAADLFDACNMLRNGVMRLASSSSWNIIVAKDDEDIQEQLLKIVSGEVKTQDDGKMAQYIAWQNKDVRMINVAIQQELLTAGLVGPAFWRSGYQMFYQGDRVVFGGDNQPDVNLSNAMTGTVTRILTSASGRQVSVGMVVKWDADDVPESTVRANSGILRDIWLSYCMTVHKSQGSEYDMVVIPCYECQKMIRCLDRRWLYTAATRAKSKVIIICTRDVVDFVKKEPSAAPTSAMSHFLRGLM